MKGRTRVRAAARHTHGFEQARKNQIRFLIHPDEGHAEVAQHRIKPRDTGCCIRGARTPAAYESSPAPFKSPDFRMAVGDPLLLEEVLLKHRRLRLLVLHAGWPRLEPMLALLYAHPGVHVDLAGLHAELPAAEYERYLRGLVQAGFGGRILVGSDFTHAAGAGIDAVLDADFLTSEQKAASLCGNAARFLRLDPALCDP